MNQSSWPKNPLVRALFGEKQVSALGKQFAVSEVEAAEIVLEYAMFKNSVGVIC